MGLLATERRIVQKRIAKRSEDRPRCIMQLPDGKQCRNEAGHHYGYCQRCWKGHRPR